eukprot:TRINITY_DN7729_c0_g1_i1.p1 TRINITY_DN7729_c0_g1~~TRINITY_DN7729_c0_g1_i1.p1  ORF type:complete len:123 (+),score=6.73 TRINITY_DN7729_c0_g1_i1:316-684(+)
MRKMTTPCRPCRGFPEPRGWAWPCRPCGGFPEPCTPTHPPKNSKALGKALKKWILWVLGLAGGAAGPEERPPTQNNVGSGGVCYRLPQAPQVGVALPTLQRLTQAPVYREIPNPCESRKEKK